MCIAFPQLRVWNGGERMKTQLRTAVAISAIVMFIGGGSAFARIADKKLCKDLGQLKIAVSTLESLPPESTLGEVKAASSQVRQAGQAVSQQSARDPNAK